MFTPKIFPIIGLCFICSTTAATEANNTSSSSHSHRQAELATAMPSKIDAKISEMRRMIMNEAVTAIGETKKAVAALDKNKAQDALNALEKAMGELEVALARDPHLAFAAIDTRITLHDLYSSLESIDQARKRAEDYLRDSQIQKARDILSGLASEIIVSVVSIPLATYPEMIRDAIPLIDAGKIKEAKTALQVALDSLVVTNHIIPLGIMRAEQYLDKAETLAEKKDRTEVENTSLKLSLDNARFQLRMSEALGYGDKNDYKPIYAHIDKIENDVMHNRLGSVFFNDVRKFFTDLTKPFD